jgi:hypothetical protein
VILLVACGPEQEPAAFNPEDPRPDVSLEDSEDGGSTLAPAQRIAIIGDYGSEGTDAEEVSKLVKSWVPDFVLTTGDNNYPSGRAETIDANVGQYYSTYIGDYKGEYGPGSPTNRFWPSPGNHEWHTQDMQPYLDYFTLPGNERYYDVRIGDVHFFSYDSAPDEPDGTDAESVQGEWLRSGLQNSNACWKIVYMHLPPYSSGSHGSSEHMRLPFAEWGADMVLAGHDHTYERLEAEGVTYFVSGLGGRSIYDFGEELEETQFRYNEDFGALFFLARPGDLRSVFINVDGERFDEHRITKDCP